MLTRAENDRLTQVSAGTAMGTLLRRYWVPVLLSTDLPEADGDPLRLRILGEDLVAFRDSSGSVGVMAEHCPHRGASLYLGRNEEGGLRCVYHGWKFDVSGRCVDMPNEPADLGFRDKISHTAYPCQEAAGVIWAYLGPPQRPPALPELEWMTVPPAHRLVSRRLQASNWLQALEGGFDSSHIYFLHRGDLPGVDATPHWQGQFNFGRMEIAPSPAGFVLGIGRDIPDGATQWSIQQWVAPWYKGFSNVFGDHPIHGHAWVPVDDRQVMVWSMDYRPERPLSQEERALSDGGGYIHVHTGGGDHPLLGKEDDYGLDRQRQRRRESFTGIAGIGLQDTAIQENQGVICDRTQEHLGASDLPVIALRRRLLRALREEPPVGLDPAGHHLRSSSVTLPRGTSFEQVGLETMARA